MFIAGSQFSIAEVPCARKPMCPEQTAHLHLEHMADFPAEQRKMCGHSSKEERNAGSSADASANAVSCKESSDNITSKSDACRCPREQLATRDAV